MSNVETLLQDPNMIARRVAEHISGLSREVHGLVYSPTGEHSYYMDFVAHQKGRAGPDVEKRLKQHAEQVERAHVSRGDHLKRLGAAGFEYRVTPQRTDGYGGYFSPPLWLDQLFATANRPGRVLAGLMARFPLPSGVSQISVPTLTTGTASGPARDDAAVAEQDLADALASSSVVPLGGQADIPLQLLEQSPQGAHLDWAIFSDLTEAYDADLEEQLLTGSGTNELLGVANVPGIVSVTYTSGSPTGSAMWPYLAQIGAQLGDGRKRPPECWLMRTARWFWLQGSEDTATRPFGLSTAFYLGSDEGTPDPIGGLMGLPVFPDDAIPATLGGSQDRIFCLRPRDSILLEGPQRNVVAREPLSGALGIRLQMHCNVAALTGRRPAGIGVLSGTGLTVQSGY